MRNKLFYIFGLLLVSSVVWTASFNLPDFGIIPKATGSRPTGSEGDLFTDSTTHRLQYKDNSSWYNLIGPATTDTLTNKTLSGNIAATLQSGTGSITFNTNGAITVPNGTDTLVGKATTDTLTNKTMSGASNTFTNIPLSSAVTGTLPIANGGTNNGSLAVTNGGMIYTDGTKFMNVGAASASGALLFSNTTTGVPAWSWGSYVAKTANYNVSPSDNVIQVDSSGGAFSLTFPSAVTYSGKVYEVVQTNAASNSGVTLVTTSAQTIGGVATGNIILNTKGDRIRIVSDGANWQILDWQIYVGGYWNGNPTGTINGGTANVYPTKYYGDPNTDYSSSTGLFTARYSGYYNFSVQGHISFTTGSFVGLVVYNNTQAKYICGMQLPFPSTMTNQVQTQCSANGVLLNAGDQVQTTFNANGSPTFWNQPTYHHFSWTMVQKTKE